MRQLKRLELTMSEKNPVVEIENLEIRNLKVVDDIELRVSDGDSPQITGYAAKYNKWSEDLGWFVERIKKGAFDDALKNSDVRALKNHDPNLLLGRTPETLRLKSNSVGLHFEIDPPDTGTVRDVIEEIRSKVLTGCSFAFTVAEDSWNYDVDPMQRTIIKIGRLFDVGPVTYPAYPDTTVDTKTARRSLDLHKAEVEEEKRQKEDESTEETEEQKKQKRERRRDIDSKYRKAGRIINRNKSAEV